MKNFTCLCFWVFASSLFVQAQSNSAIFEIESTTQGFLLPRMDSVQRNAISGPTDGLLIYNNSNQRINYYNGPDSTWEEIFPVSATTNIFDYFQTLPNGLQALIDMGHLPGRLLDEGIDPEDLIGLVYGGGIIFHINPDGSGLVAAPFDQSTGAQWGCNYTYLPGRYKAGVGEGAANTILILEECPDLGIAARICADLTLGGFDDWFLPSDDELLAMWQNLADSDGNGTNSGPGDPGNLAGFSAAYYSSSHQGDDESIYSINFSNGGYTDAHPKSNFLPVRAVRAF